MTTKIETVQREGLTLSKMIWALLGRQPAGYAEIVLAANPGLAALGPELPVGTKIAFPLDEVPSDSQQVEQAVRLWD